MEEIWKPILGYEDCYEVSNMGRVRSINRLVRGKTGNLVPRSGRELQPVLNSRGYQVVSLAKKGATKQFFVHRLVAETFIPNPQHFPQINHKDEIKTNNKVGNLEWCSMQYNLSYGTRNDRIIEKLPRRKVAQCDMRGVEICVFDSIHEAARELGVQTQKIWACCNNRDRRKSTGGFKWRYA